MTPGTLKAVQVALVEPVAYLTDRVSVYDLIPTTSEQLELFSSPIHKVSDAMDKINDR